MRKVRNQKGFTIMELMIVIVIIGILIAIAVPAYNRFTARARRSACLSNQRTLESANGLRFADIGSYASDAAGLVNYAANAASIVCPEGTAYGYNTTTGAITCTTHPKVLVTP